MARRLPSVGCVNAYTYLELNWRLFVPESWDDTCVPDPDGKPANPHARRLRQQPVTLDQAGAKKPHTRVQLPRAEQIDQIRRRRAASKVPDAERYRPKWLMALEMLDESSLSVFGRPGTCLTSLALTNHTVTPCASRM